MRNRQRCLASPAEQSATRVPRPVPSRTLMASLRSHRPLKTTCHGTDSTASSTSCTRCGHSASSTWQLISDPALFTSRQSCSLRAFTNPAEPPRPRSRSFCSTWFASSAARSGSVANEVKLNTHLVVWPSGSASYSRLVHGL